MSTISVCLTRIDLPGESEIILPKGDISIGRGSILGCDDKRISRKHCCLQVSEDGVITLVSLHTNPCFYKVQNLDSYAVLLKGQSKTLHDGDELALLPNSFQYRVAVRPEVGGVPSVLLSEEPCVIINETNKDKKIHATQEVEQPTNQEQSYQSCIQDSGSPISDSVCTTPSKRKRVLPQWLSNLSGDEPFNSTIKVATPSTSTDTTGYKRKVSTSETIVKKVKSDVKEELPDVSIKFETDVHDHTSAQPIPGDSGQHQLSDDESEVKPSTGLNKDGYEAEYGEASSTATGVPNDTNRNAAPAGTPSREPCIYATNCYRKNPQHRADFSHPGDADFHINQDLPECPFGTSCYRKNLQHRKDYKHTQQPSAPPTYSPSQSSGDSPQTRTKRRTTTRDKDDSSEDDYDHDDPFLNDGTSDDYEPTSSEDSDLDEEEDEDEESQERRRMLKEAKKFTRKKKVKNSSR